MMKLKKIGRATDGSSGMKFLKNNFILTLNHTALDGDPASPLPRRETAPPNPNFRRMSVVAKQLDGSICHVIGR